MKSVLVAAVVVIALVALVDSRDIPFEQNSLDPYTEDHRLPGGGLEGIDISDEGRLLIEDGTVENNRKKGGGSKCKSDIVCSLLGGACISDTTYCSGREVPNLCGGEKCKCCFTVNMEVKIHDMETEFRSMAGNITIANSHLHEKLESMMNLMITAISNQSDVISNQSNVISEQFNVISNLESKTDSIISANTNMKKDLDSMMASITDANTDQDTKLDTIMENQGCPEGMFLFSETDQCFQLLNDKKRNWDDSKVACKARGLDLAHPYSLVTLRIYLLTKYGDSYVIWLNGRGDGSNVKWQDNGQNITKENPTWWPGHPYVTADRCLGFLHRETWWKQNPTRPLFMHICTHLEYALCELVAE